jgi:hypothetical protein
MIAISYRREDSLPITGRIYDRLQSEFGKSNVFMDFDSIPYGVDFREHIKQMIHRSKMVVAIIGPDWLGKRRYRARRIDDPADFVRLEIGYALERRLPIIPVLIDDTPMPKATELPKDIEGLAFRNALTLDVGIDFHHHIDRLVAGINRLLMSPPPAAVSAESKRQPPASAELRTEQVKPVTSTARAKTAKPAVPQLPSLVGPPQPSAKPKLSSPSSDVGSALLHHAQEPLVETKPQEATQIESETVGAETAASVSPAKSAESEAPPEDGKSSEALQLPPKRLPIFSQKEGWPSRAEVRGKTVKPAVGASENRDVNSSVEVVDPSFFERFSKLLAIVAGAVFVTILGAVILIRLAHTNRVVGPKDAQPSSQTVVKSETSPAPTIVPTPTPLPVVGALRVGSDPDGLKFELTDAAGKHYSGTTPETIEGVESGYAEVVYEKATRREHREMVWISKRETSSVSWRSPVEPQLTIAATIAPSRPASNDWKPRIEEFVRQYVQSNALADVDREVSFYAANSEIFNEGRKSLVAIRADIQSYKAKWPVRSSTIRGEIHLSETATDEYNASFDQDYYVENPARHQRIQGAVAVDLRIAIVGGSPKITSITQKTLKPGAPSAEQPPPLSPAMAAQESTVATLPVVPGSPQKLVRIFNKQYGFSVLVPSEVFPDAARPSETDQTRFFTPHGETTLSVLVHPNSSESTLNQLYQGWTAEHTRAEPNRKVHYKPFRGNWFVVSGTNGQKGERGFYVKAVRKGNIVVMMLLEYDEDASPLKNETLAKMSKSFDGN